MEPIATPSLPEDSEQDLPEESYEILEHSKNLSVKQSPDVINEQHENAWSDKHAQTLPSTRNGSPLSQQRPTVQPPRFIVKTRSLRIMIYQQQRQKGASVRAKSPRREATIYPIDIRIKSAPGGSTRFKSGHHHVDCTSKPAHKNTAYRLECQLNNNSLLNIKSIKAMATEELEIYKSIKNTRNDTCILIEDPNCSRTVNNTQEMRNGFECFSSASVNMAEQKLKSSTQEIEVENDQSDGKFQTSLDGVVYTSHAVKKKPVRPRTTETSWFTWEFRNNQPKYVNGLVINGLSERRQPPFPDTDSNLSTVDLSSADSGISIDCSSQGNSECDTNVTSVNIEPSRGILLKSNSTKPNSATRPKSISFAPDTKPGDNKAAVRNKKVISYPGNYIKSSTRVVSANAKFCIPTATYISHSSHPLEVKPIIRDNANTWNVNCSNTYGVMSTAAKPFKDVSCSVTNKPVSIRDRSMNDSHLGGTKNIQHQPPVESGFISSTRRGCSASINKGQIGVPLDPVLEYNCDTLQRLNGQLKRADVVNKSKERQKKVREEQFRKFEKHRFANEQLASERVKAERELLKSVMAVKKHMDVMPPTVGRSLPLENDLDRYARRMDKYNGKNQSFTKSLASTSSWQPSDRGSIMRPHTQRRNVDDVLKQQRRIRERGAFTGEINNVSQLQQQKQKTYQMQERAKTLLMAGNL